MFLNYLDYSEISEVCCSHQTQVASERLITADLHKKDSSLGFIEGRTQPALILLPFGSRENEVWDVAHVLAPPVEPPDDVIADAIRERVNVEGDVCKGVEEVASCT